ncbi:Protein gamma response 1 [Zea mays]|uniref:Protein gamma response 1 n=2 Tax=Zea mays TaxID=4577 RepID=K7VFQ2_MAIZE|nr:Protein gamma response 1 [Zea mays]AQL04982.1 Protein gamma response 1 [Zea mays]AQL04983.1 Protein gamma response 1 [Zea mays]
MEGKAVAVGCGGARVDPADDLKYISGLSTILVATIQEVKDQVSQMEFIFCSQLFPHIQAKSKLVQAHLADTMKASEVEWRKTEAGLVKQLEEVSRGKMLAEERLLQLGTSLEEMKRKLVDSEQLAARHEAEKKQLLGRLEDETRKGEVVRQLQREIEEKDAEVVREREAHQRLLQEFEQLAARHESEKKQLLGRLEDEMGNGEVVRQLQREIEEKAAEVVREREAHQRLQQQVDLKDKNLLLEQSKRRDLIEDYTQLKTNYKHLKSQYTFLLGKIDQHEGSKPPEDIPADRRNTESPPSKRKFKDLEHTNKERIQILPNTRDLKNDSAPGAKAQAAQHASSVRSPIRNSHLAVPSRPMNPLANHSANNSKLQASTSVASPCLNWRETRARKEQGVADPHDDFLDTPLEAVKNTIRNPATPEEALALAASPQVMDFDNSDDETQDLNIATQALRHIPNMPVTKQQNTISVHPPKKDFKYRESVRKKADRENLKGVECKQCKKFYDAVLPGGRADGDGAGSTSLRCEHHDGVSRHRYRYAPPLTPEGFWNIGFESEM